ncbi:MAG TPA: membrane protein insertase YidC [Deltaproteobacteria bacterium]|nr:membrane protein insertase YidC [Deltaproteobacteria bacterium]
MMDEKQRTALALALSALILVAWFALYDYMNASRRDDAAPPVPAVQQGKRERPAVQAPGPQPAALAQPSTPEVAAERVIVVDTPLYTASFTSRGARLTSFRLKKYLTSMGQDARPTEIMKAPMPSLVLEGLGNDSDIVYRTSAPTACLSAPDPRASSSPGKCLRA